MRKNFLTVGLTGETMYKFLAIKEILGKNAKTRHILNFLFESREELLRLREENETLKGIIKKLIKE